MSRILAISDIHGCFDTFSSLLEKVDLSKDDELYLLGDFIDRGPKSKEVIDWVLEKQEAGFEINCIRGNHEQMLLNVLKDFTKTAHWLRNGGKQVLENFKVNSAHEIPQKYIDFCEELKFYFQSLDYFFVHAGINFHAVEPMEDYEAMIWIRNWEEDLDEEWLEDRRVVHGHTMVSKDIPIERISQPEKYKVINIDGGCYAANFDSKLGNLLCADLTNNKIYFQENLDKINITHI